MVNVYSTPLTTRFRGIEVRDGVLLAGPAGWGEFSPFWDYDDAESVSWWLAAWEAAHVGWPPALRTHIPVNVTVPATDPERAHQIVLASGGCRTAKVKVAERGQGVDEEIARLEAVRDALGLTGAIRIDANGAWDVETAVERLRLLDRAAGGLEYVEQPCATVPELAEVRRRTSVLVAADESIRRAEDPFAVVRAQAADIIVLKVQPLGGVRACLDLAEQVALPVVVSSALESSVGLAAGLALAAALPRLDHACGLATSQLLVRDTVPDPLLPVDGMIEVRRPVPDAASLAATDAHLLDPLVAQRWEQRATRVARLAQARPASSGETTP
ncbi:O-succinylbenzoate synthase [Sanguibacter gelidistatuariae]|uniref:o-succinylbenzoate synthase n=1 Tax=Sanguibacter gelidistatuariae TaxID=1814289 RepID=A0A1G6X1F0_9MICO|nr:o-succinylbenzoate synthase [Sanguibacter gelidistatuariae]SDD71869.1 O-succinylbenzoate synthase [Sanguibacter gelidistatuariae]